MVDMGSSNEILKKLGEINKCLYCKKVLNKIPTRKSKCSFCNKYIYFKMRPQDRQRVLVTEQQAKELEDQWELIDIENETKEMGEKLKRQVHG